MLTSVLQMQSLLNEEALNDVNIYYGYVVLLSLLQKRGYPQRSDIWILTFHFWLSISNGTMLQKKLEFYQPTETNRIPRCRDTKEAADKANGFLLSLLSPVWRTKLCGLFGCQQRAELKLAGGEATAFRQLLELGCGEKVVLDGGLEELMSLGRMAHRYQLELVQCAVEDAVLSRHLTVESCGSVLAGSCGNGLERLARAGRELALREFDAFSRTDGLMALDEEVLGSLLDDDELTSEREERVFEALVRWMKAGSDGRGLRGEGLLLKIRFPFMDSMYLADLASRPAVDGAGLDGLLLDSSTLRGVPRHLWAGRQLRFLDARALAPRGRVRWEDYAAAGGGERRLAAGQWVCRVAAHGGYVCGGLRDGSIRVWGRSTLEKERTLIGHTSHVWTLLWARGRLVSSSLDRSARVWDVSAG